MRREGIIGALVVLGLACVAGAADDVLRLLVWEGHAPPGHVRGFEQSILEQHQRRVTLQVTYVSGSDDFYTAIRGKQADVVMMTHHHFYDERFDYVRKGLLLPLDMAHVPNFKQVIPALQRAEHVVSEGRVYAVPVSRGPYGLAYNTSLVAEPPTSWNALWDPRFRGGYVIAENEYIYNATITALALGYPRGSVNSYAGLNNGDFKRKLRELVEHADSFWEGVDKPENLRGRMLATVWGDSLPALAREGEQWQMADPVEGTPSWIDNYAITWALADKPFLKEVAEAYINGVLTRSYQREHIQGRLGLCSVIVESADPAGGETPPASMAWTRNSILLQPCSTRDRNGLKLLWQEAWRGASRKGEGGVP